jgi:hypothetical protein
VKLFHHESAYSQIVAEKDEIDDVRIYTPATSVPVCLSLPSFPRICSVQTMLFLLRHPRKKEEMKKKKKR